METPTTTQPHIADYIRPLTSRKWLILLAVVVATGGVYAWYRHKPNIYTASTLVFVKDPGDPVTGTPSPQSTDRQVQNEASLLDSRDTAESVKGKIHYSGTAAALLERVSITSRQGQDFVNVSAEGRSAAEAATIANSFAAEFVSLINGAQSTRIGNAIKLTQSQLAQLPAGQATGVQRATLLDQLNRLQLAQVIPTTVARQINPALPPGGPSAPKPVRNALFALILSLIGAVAVAYGLERFDRRLRSPDEVEQAYASPLLAVVPHTGQPAPLRNGEPTLGPDFREPFWMLRTNLELASLDKPPRTIVVSSAMPGEGKSTVVRNLALAFRDAGKRVVVVDLDLRHPAMARMFGTPPGRGVTEVLRHDAELETVTLQIGVGVRALDEHVLADAAEHAAPNGTNGRNGNARSAATIALLTSGARPANPPAVLASGRLVEVLNELRERYDVVLIDSAPVLAVADTVPLLRYADAVVFVGRLGITTRDTAKRLREFLTRVPDVNLLGLVANDLSRLGAGAYGYGYGYHRDRDDASPAGDARKWTGRRRSKQMV
jgi:Mrp family chromosome partitioning ATPase